jgi:hypothetical protein
MASKLFNDRTLLVVIAAGVVVIAFATIIIAVAVRPPAEKPVETEAAAVARAMEETKQASKRLQQQLRELDDLERGQR